MCPLGTSKLLSLDHRIQLVARMNEVKYGNKAKIMKLFFQQIVVFLLALSLSSVSIAKVDSFSFTANQPPLKEPGISLWKSFYAWGKKQPKSFSQKCLAKSFRCSINITAKPGKPVIASTYITFDLFNWLQKPRVYILTKKGWKFRSPYERKRNTGTNQK